jgi:hypothetical protein
LLCFDSITQGFGGQQAGFGATSAAAPSGPTAKYTAMFQFDATRDDELSVYPGDSINVISLANLFNVFEES